MGCVTTMKIEDKKRLVKLISFMTMGDGSIYHNRGSKNCLFSMSMTEDHRDFLEYCQGILENVTSCKMIKYTRDLPRKNLLKIYTPLHPFFNAIRDRIYFENYKSIDIHALKLLDFEALAILYMCDGCLGKYEKDGKVVSYTLTLNLCRLSYGDYLVLKKALKEYLDLEFNVVKTGTKYFTLRLRSKDIPRFIEGVTPYMTESFLYKVDFRTNSPSIKEGDDIV